MKHKKITFKIGKHKFTDFTIKSLAGFILGWLIGLLAFILLGIMFVSTPMFDQKIHNPIIDKSFNIVANSWENTEVVNSLAYLCSLKNETKDKLYCVYSFISNNVVFGYHHKGTNILNRPEEIFNKPDVCRDVAVLFKSTLNRMNIDNDFVHEPGHIYNVVYLENETCEVDIVNNIFDCEKN